MLLSILFLSYPLKKYARQRSANKCFSIFGLNSLIFPHLAFIFAACKNKGIRRGRRVVKPKYSWKLESFCEQPELPSPAKSHDGTGEALCMSER